jgi:hypothetical protein
MNQEQREDLQRDVHAALEARHELGSAYDEHFAQQLTERMMTQVRREMAQTPRPVAPRVSNKLDRSQRTAVAICSLVFAIPLIAIGADALGTLGFVGAIALIAVINFFSAL